MPVDLAIGPLPRRTLGMPHAVVGNAGEPMGSGRCCVGKQSRQSRAERRMPRNQHIARHVDGLGAMRFNGQLKCEGKASGRKGNR